MTYLLIFFSNLLISIFLFPRIIAILNRVKIVDVPDGFRKVHQSAIPRMGGLFIFICVLATTVTFYYDLNSIRSIIWGAIVIVICGIVDDMAGLSWKSKLFLQAASSFYVIYYFYPFIHTVSLFGFNFYYPFNIILMFVFIVGALNAVNMMDGMDGLVGGFSLVISGIAFLLAWHFNDELLIMMLAGLSGALIGFLKFNAYPASVFLGDTGSLYIGYLLIFSTISISIRKYAHVDLTVSLFLLGIPIFDTLKVMLIRKFNKKSMFLPDRTHFHHVFSSFNIRHKTTVFIIQLFSLLFVIITLTYLSGAEIAAYIMFGASIIIILYAEQILSLVFRTRAIECIYNFRDLLSRLIRSFNANLAVLIIFFIILMLGFYFPLKASYPPNYNLLILVFLLSLFILSFYRNFKWKAYTEVYVFTCWVIFFMIANPQYRVINVFFPGNPSVHLLLTSITFALGILIGIFFFTRDHIFDGKVSLLKGFDLIIIVLISLIFILSFFFDNTVPEYLGLNIVDAYLVYVSYKILILLRPRMMKFLFYCSFSIPIGTLVGIILVK